MAFGARRLDCFTVRTGGVRDSAVFVGNLLSIVSGAPLEAYIRRLAIYLDRDRQTRLD